MAGIGVAWGDTGAHRDSGLDALQRDVRAAAGIAAGRSHLGHAGARCSILTQCHYAWQVGQGWWDTPGLASCGRCHQQLAWLCQGTGSCPPSPWGYGWPRRSYLLTLQRSLQRAECHCSLPGCPCSAPRVPRRCPQGTPDVSQILKLPSPVPILGWAPGGTRGTLLSRPSSFSSFGCR